MHNGKTFLAIIPARGGSRRLPHKNVLDLGGKPLIGWSIEAGVKSRYIDKVIVSSDSDEILQISQKYGAATIKRPNELANETATTFDAIEHTLAQCSGYDYVVLLQPTSPFRNEHHIDNAIELLSQKSADAVISVCETEHSPLWSNTLPSDNSLDGFVSDSIKNLPSQSLPLYYRLNGAIYICQTNRLLEEKTFLFRDNIFAYVMDKDCSVDIDTALDFKVAECLMAQHLSHNLTTKEN